MTMNVAIKEMAVTAGEKSISIKVLQVGGQPMTKTFFEQLQVGNCPFLVFDGAIDVGFTVRADLWGWVLHKGERWIVAPTSNGQLRRLTAGQFHKWISEAEAGLIWQSNESRCDYIRARKSVDHAFHPDTLPQLFIGA